MLRLGLRLSLRSGREALVRLVLTTVAVAIGVTLLLSVFADFHAFQATSKTPSWAATQPAKSSQPASTMELWNYSESIYKGQFIKLVDVAALGARAPVPPGIARLPAAGQYYASPALAALLRAVPRDQLGARFQGTQIGTIGPAALTGPNELAVIVGYAPAALASVPNTIRVDKISTAPQINGTTNLYRLAFGIGAIALLFPLLILISTASRLSATRRDERYAAMRLVGATPRQINVLATADAVVGALLGVLLGTGVFVLVRPALAGVSLSGAQFFASTVTPTVWGYAGMLVVVPLAAAVTSYVSLRRVKISPLGVARKGRTPPPRIWRVLPLLIGIPLFVLPLVDVSRGVGAGRAPVQNNHLGPAYLGLLLIMVGLVVGGAWLTMRAAGLLARFSTGAGSLLAARRLTDNPRGAFRAISGLVLAVFVATSVSVLATTVNAAQTKTAADTELSNVLFVQYGDGPRADVPAGTSAKAVARATGGLDRLTGATLIRALTRYPGVQVLPIYTTRGAAPVPRLRQRLNIGDDDIVSCQSLKQLPALGACAPGIAAVRTSADILGTDNPLSLNRGLPLVDQHSPASSANLGRLRLGSLLVSANNSDTLERVRTYLSTDNALSTGGIAPETFGETAQVRNNDDANIERVVLFAVVLTLLVAGCSLAVTVGGGLVERKRPFTLLRLSGTSTSVLYKVVCLESTLPLVAGCLVAALTGLAVAVPVVDALVPKGTHAALPGHAYFLTMSLGLVVAFAVILATLPLLNRMTEPENARFE